MVGGGVAAAGQGLGAAEGEPGGVERVAGHPGLGEDPVPAGGPGQEGEALCKREKSVRKKGPGRYVRACPPYYLGWWWWVLCPDQTSDGGGVRTCT